VANGVDVEESYDPSFFPNFYLQYMQLVQVHNTSRRAMLLAKNIKNIVYNEQHLVTNYTTFVMPFVDNKVAKRLSEVHKVKIEGNDFNTTFDICSWKFMYSCRFIFYAHNVCLLKQCVVM
jgi:hypothetical protein